MNEKLDLLNGSISLFTEIDINGDGTVEWSEFVQYVTDQCETYKNRRPLDGPGATEPNYLLANQKKEKLTEFHCFRLDDSITDPGKHKRPMLQALYNKGPSYSTLQRPCVMYTE